MGGLRREGVCAARKGYQLVPVVGREVLKQREA